MSSKENVFIFYLIILLYLAASIFTCDKPSSYSETKNHERRKNIKVQFNIEDNGKDFFLVFKNIEKSNEIEINVDRFYHKIILKSKKPFDKVPINKIDIKKGVLETLEISDNDKIIIQTNRNLRITKDFIEKKQEYIVILNNYKELSSLLPVNKEVERIHKEAFICDLHNDTINHIFFTAKDISKESSGLEIDIPKLKRGNIGLLICSVWISDYFTPEYKAPDGGYFDFYKKYDKYKGHALKLTLEMIEKLKESIDNNSQDLKLALSYSDAINIKKSGKIAVMISVEGAHVLGDDPENIKTLYDAGVRSLILTWNNTNAFATSSKDASGDDIGISKKGIELVKKCMELGIILDVSHSSDKTVYDLLSMSNGKNPIIASHSCARGLNDLKRNIPDRIIVEIGNCGGVIGVNFHSGFLKNMKNASIEDVLDQIDYMSFVYSPLCIALGSDFDGYIKTPEKLENISLLRNITLGLYNRGYNEDEIKGILGDNFLKTLKKFEKKVN